jgi:hypothetical protein
VNDTFAVEFSHSDSCDTRFLFFSQSGFRTFELDSSPDICDNPDFGSPWNFVVQFESQMTPITTQKAIRPVAFHCYHDATLTASDALTHVYHNIATRLDHRELPNLTMIDDFFS